MSPLNTLTWVQYLNGNNNLLDLIQSSTSSGDTVLYDSRNDKYLKLNSLNMYSGKSLNSIKTYEFDGQWTSFAPGFSIYGPSQRQNNSRLK